MLHIVRLLESVLGLLDSVLLYHKLVDQVFIHLGLHVPVMLALLRFCLVSVLLNLHVLQLHLLFVVEC